MSKSRRQRKTSRELTITRRNFLKKSLLVVEGIAVSGGIGSYLWNYLTREPEVTLKMLKEVLTQKLFKRI